MSLLIKLCDDYLHDRLSDEERKAFEERIAKGDKELIETLYQLKSFGKSSPKFVHDLEESSDSEPDLFKMVAEKPPVVEPRERASEESESTLVQVLKELDKKDLKKNKSLFFTILGSLFIVLLVLVIYQQWNTYLLDRKVDLLQKQVDVVTKERAELRVRNREVEFNLNRIRSVVSAEFFVPTKMNLKGDRGAWIQLWDRGTLRTLVMIEQPKFANGEVLQLWSRNARTRDWQLVGSIDKITSDSLYTQWDGQMMARSIGLQVKLLSKDKTDEVIGEFRVK